MPIIVKGINGMMKTTAAHAFVLSCVFALQGLVASSGDIANARELFRRLQDIGRSGRTVYAWSTSASNWSPEGWRMFKDATGHEPLLYFVEFRDIGGTWYPRERYERNRVAFAETVKRNWRLRRAVPMVTWHIQNPYVPEKWTHPQYGNNCGMRYVAYGQDATGYHKQVLREILDGTGTTCGYGRIDGRNEKTFANPRAWFEWCLRDVAAFCRTLTDDEGRRIPIVFRPFHEMDGGWFWWGKDYASPADVAGAFRLFADIMREELGRENVLMCYSPDKTWSQLGKIGEDGFLTWYPGNDYADLIGWDDYGIGAGATETDRRANALRTLGKMRAVSEFGLANDKVCGIWESGNRMFGKNDVDRPGFYRTLHELATAPGVAFSVMTTYDGPCTFPNTDAGKREMAEFLAAPETVVDDWNGKSRDAAAFVDPFVGTKFPGNTFPGACRPFGLVQPGPDTTLEGMWKCSGYQFVDGNVYGFSQDHVSGTGCPVGGDLRILPFSGVRDVRWDLSARKDGLTERSEPGYYRVRFAEMGVETEITCTKRVGYYRFSFDQGDAHVLVDTQFGLTHTTNQLHRHVVESTSRVDAANRRISGFNVCRAWNQHEYGYVLSFSRPWKAIRKLPRLQDEQADRYVLDFDLAPGERLEARAALSFVDEAGAVRNLEAEGGLDFERVKADARAEWNRLLSRVDLPGADETEKRMFYTGVYHASVQPNSVTDVDGRYRTGIFLRGENATPHGRVGTVRKGREIYSNFSLWDTFRAVHPFYTLFAPEMVDDFVESMLEQYRVCGFLPVIPYLGQDTLCMIANHSVPVVVDAWLKGFRGFDGDLAYEAVTNSLTVEHNGKIKEDWRMYEKYGYYPYDKVNGENVSRSMECSFNDVCAARLAEARGDGRTAAWFRHRAALWTNNFDSAYGLVRGKNAKGEWREPFDEYFWAAEFKKHDCTEATPWIYTFHVLHDVPTLISLFGGREPFVRKLDLFFTEAVSAVTGKRRKIGEFGMLDQGNEPSHHIPFLYQWAGRGDRTAELVRDIVRRRYNAGPRGLCGNDDCGQMSCWYLFACMGFYPVDPCGGEYVIGAPQMREVRMSLPGGKTLRTVARNLSERNLCVKSVTWNGKPVEGFVVRHADLVQGGDLVFEMTKEK